MWQCPAGQVLHRKLSEQARERETGGGAWPVTGLVLEVAGVALTHLLGQSPSRAPPRGKDAGRCEGVEGASGEHRCVGQNLPTQTFGQRSLALESEDMRVAGTISSGEFQTQNHIGIPPRRTVRRGITPRPARLKRLHTNKVRRAKQALSNLGSELPTGYFGGACPCFQPQVGE